MQQVSPFCELAYDKLVFDKLIFNDLALNELAEHMLLHAVPSGRERCVFE